MTENLDATPDEVADVADSGRASLFAYRRYRNAEAEFDARWHDGLLRELGVVEDDEPTEYSHFAYMQQFEQRAAGDFSPEERVKIRAHLGLGPFGESDV